VNSIDQVPTFNLKAVVQETGLKPDTLRAWERRYGLPQPRRTAGRHRLYSQRDIDVLKWLMARREEGLSISRAVALWREIEAGGQDPLRAPAYTVPESGPEPVFFLQGETINALRRAWLSACLAFDEQRAGQALTQAFALYPPETVCVELLQKGLAEVGVGWYGGEVSVQQEHFSSALALRHLEALVASAPPPTRPGRMLAGCPPEEEHAFSPLLLTYLLKRRGWDVVYLGARVPLARMEATVAAVQPRLVLLSAQRLYTAATLYEMAQLLRREGVPLAYGGRIFNLLPALRQRIPGHFLGERLDLAPQRVEGLLASPRPVPAGTPVSDAYREALSHFRERRTLLEADVMQHDASWELSSAQVTLANTEMADNIIAALKLGDVSFLSAEIDWLEGLSIDDRMSPDALRRYLERYTQSAQSRLDERGRPLLDGLRQVVGRA